MLFERRRRGCWFQIFRLGSLYPSFWPSSISSALVVCVYAVICRELIFSGVLNTFKGVLFVSFLHHVSVSH